MQRITIKDLQAVCNRLNRETNSPMEYMTDGKINVDHFHISQAYGGYCLHRTMNDGGEYCPIDQYHGPARDLYNKMHAFLSGMYFGQEMQAKADSLFISK